MDHMPTIHNGTQGLWEAFDAASGPTAYVFCLSPLHIYSVLDRDMYLVDAYLQRLFGLN